MLYAVLATLIYVSSFELPFFSPSTLQLAVTFGFPMLPLFPLLFLLLLPSSSSFFFPPLLCPLPSLESGRTKSSEHAPRAFHLAIEAIVDSSAQSNLDFFSKVNYSAGLSRKGLLDRTPGVDRRKCKPTCFVIIGAVRVHFRRVHLRLYFYRWPWKWK